ncbi:MAG: hypothetical protein E7062_01730 [Spirochaetaceae bacterium]|nr:hypothetical protein [Spirochaetaceae bacterium]
MKHATKITAVMVLVFSLFLMTSCIETQVSYEGASSFFVENKTVQDLTVCFVLNSNSLEKTDSVNVTAKNTEKIWEGTCIGCNPTPEMILKSLSVYDKSAQLVYEQVFIQNGKWIMQVKNSNISEYTLVINSL